jgi:hypothetical protein
MFESLMFRPNYPTNPQRTFNFYTFPNDLETDERKYFCELQFYDYDSGIRVGNRDLGEAFNDATKTISDVSSLSDLKDLWGKTTSTPKALGFEGQGAGLDMLGYMSLPIPARVNDNVSFIWGEDSLQSLLARGISNVIPDNRLLQFLNQNQNLGFVSAGVAINPMMYQQFQRQGFRSFNFQWLLSPRTKTESVTLNNMITLLKRASTPGKTLDGFLLTYPAVVMIKFHPNDINGNMKMKPCIIENINIDYTAAGTPSFFKDGAPVVVSINISVKEIQLWYKEDHMKSNNNNYIPTQELRSPISSVRDDRATPVPQGRDDRAPSVNK